MKTILLSNLVLLLNVFVFGQNQSNITLPPNNMLSINSTMKKFYELPQEIEFKVYKRTGNLVDSGKARFIDYTKYEKGDYFIKCEDQLFQLPVYSSEKFRTKVPPIKILPKNGGTKVFFDLPHKTNYTVYDQEGNLIVSSYGEFIDRTNYKNGVYFIKFESKVFSYTLMKQHLRIE